MNFIKTLYGLAIAAVISVVDVVIKGLQHVAAIAKKRSRPVPGRRRRAWAAA